jgi:hypothetical protein
LVHHRDEVPPAELDKVRALAYGEEEPTAAMLAAPSAQRAQRLRRVPAQVGALLARWRDSLEPSWTALDGLVNQGNFTVALAPAELPVSQDRLQDFFSGLAEVWPPPSGLGPNQVYVYVTKEEAEGEHIRLRVAVQTGRVLDSDGVPT